MREKRSPVVVLMITLAFGAVRVFAGDPDGALVNGDANCDGNRDLSDAVALLNWLFLGAKEPCPLADPPELTRRIEELESQLSSAEAEIDRLGTELKICTVKLEARDAQLEACNLHLKLTSSELEAAEARIAALEVPGCMDPEADNFDCRANVDDQSCMFFGCTDPEAKNYDPQATDDDGSCVFETSLTYSGLLDSYCEGDEIFGQPSVIGLQPEFFEVEPELPEGITLDPLTGVISGEALRPAPVSVHLVRACNAVEGCVETSVVIRIQPNAPSFESMRVLADKLAIVKPIFPNEFDSVIRQASFRVKAVPLGLVTDDELLLYESLRASLVSVGLCEPCSRNDFQRSSASMHWNQDGLFDDLTFPPSRNVASPPWTVQTIDPTLSFELPGNPPEIGVPPLRLHGDGGFRDWLLAFETVSGSILAFKKDPEYRVVSDQPGEPFESNPEDSPNFGQGNGLLMGVVISGRQIRDSVFSATGVRNARVSRMIEVGSRQEIVDGQPVQTDLVLLFFTTVPAIHVLAIQLQARELDYDLECTFDPTCPEDARDFRTVMMPVGEIQFFGPLANQPFLSYQRIQTDVTQNDQINLTTFQPVYLPPQGSTACEDAEEARFAGIPGVRNGGSILVYDAGSLSFLRVAEDLRQFVLDPITRQPVANPSFAQGFAVEAISSAELLNTLDSNPPFLMSQGVNHIGCNPALILEEHSNNLLSFEFGRIDPQLPATGGGTLTILSTSEEFLFRWPSGVPPNEETILHAADNNLEEGRLYFDQGQDQILFVDFQTGNVSTLLSRGDFQRTTGRNLTKLTWIRRLPPRAERPGSELLRAFDTESTSLLDISLSTGDSCVSEP